MSSQEAQIEESLTKGQKGRATPVATGKTKIENNTNLFEVHLEDSNRTEAPTARKPSVFKSLRYFIMILALLSPFVTTYSRTIINFAITDMIEPQSKAPTNQSQVEVAYFEEDNSCPVDSTDRERLLARLKQDTRRARESPGEKFKWDTLEQGLLKASYPMGHALLQIAGSRLAEIHGPHLIMGLSSLSIGLLSLAAPYLAAMHLYCLVTDLFFLGLVGSFMTPSLITLFSNWLTPGEKSMVISFYMVSSRLGYALSSFVCGQLMQANISWRHLFFSAGWTALVFAFTFLLLVTSKPLDHFLISTAELEYLAVKNTLVRESLRDRNKSEQSVEMKEVVSEKPSGKKTVRIKLDQEKPEKKTSAPWLAILTNRSVWAFVITKFCVKLAGDTVQIELPIYLSRVMHFSDGSNGLLNTWNYIIFCISCLIVGTLAKTINKRRPFGVSKTFTRKAFQSVASFGVSLLLLGMSFSVCDDTSTTVLLTFLFFFTTFGTGGEAQIPMDITERYSGTIHAIGSSLAISGVIEPILVGLFVRGHAADRERWAKVWLVASGVAAFGGIIFVLFADATIQPFDSIGSDSDPESRPKSKARTASDNKAFEPDSLPESKITKASQDQDQNQQKPYKESQQI